MIPQERAAVADECTAERFLTDIPNHLMAVVRDDGVHRHVRFKRPESRDYSFDLITWPGHLCITGDMGTYVFQRVADIFEFFLPYPGFAAQHPDRPLFINPGYWGEKLLSVGTNAGYREFDEEKFEARVTEHFEGWLESYPREEVEAEEIWTEIKSLVLGAVEDGSPQAYMAVQDFECNEFTFQDFFDGGGTERYTFRYLWCLYAIAWGISQYDSAARG